MEAAISISTGTSKMAKTMEPMLPILFVLEYWAIILDSFGSPGRYRYGCFYKLGILFWNPMIRIIRLGVYFGVPHFL